MSGGIVVFAKPIAGPRSAVSDVGVTARKSLEERARFLPERMVVAITSAVQPPDLRRRDERSGRRQLMQHREHGSRSDARAQQDHRPIWRAERKASSRRAH